MVTAIVLINARRDRINDLASELADMDGVSEVYSVGGRYDLVAILRVPHNDDLARVVTAGMLELDGIEDTETLIAFKAHSRHDLETMFSIGL